MGCTDDSIDASMHTLTNYTDLSVLTYLQNQRSDHCHEASSDSQHRKQTWRPIKVLRVNSTRALAALSHENDLEFHRLCSRNSAIRRRLSEAYGALHRIQCAYQNMKQLDRILCRT